jgi:hypothetical protein
MAVKQGVVEVQVLLALCAAELQVVDAAMGLA